MLAGLTAQLEIRVEGNDLSDGLLNEEVGVVSTPRLLQLLEATSREAIKDHLPPGEEWLASGVRIRHLAPLPLGMKVTAHALLKEVRGNQLLFLVDAYDEVEKVAEGELEGILVPKDQTLESLRGKKEKAMTEARPRKR